MRRFLPLLLASALSSTAAAEVCGPRKDILENLGREFGETVRFEAITNGGQFLELLFSDKAGTYTVVVTEPAGRSCVIGSGIGNRLKKRRDWAPTLEH